MVRRPGRAPTLGSPSRAGLAGLATAGRGAVGGVPSRVHDHDHAGRSRSEAGGAGGTVHRVHGPAAFAALRGSPESADRTVLLAATPRFWWVGDAGQVSVTCMPIGKWSEKPVWSMGLPIPPKGRGLG